MAIVLFHPLAAKEFRAAKAWYARRSEKAAIGFREETDAALDRVVELPESHPSFAPATHWIKLRRYPYLIVDQILSKSPIKVVAIAHGRRRRGYWKRRVH